jgi:hypothetical protein
MIYLYEEGDYERRGVVAVYQTKEPMDLSYMAFLYSVGLRPRPALPQSGKDRTAWLIDINEWGEEKRAIENRDAGHRAWIESQPGVKSLDFELI